MAYTKGTILGLLLATLAGLVNGSAEAESPVPGIPGTSQTRMPHGPWGAGSENCPVLAGGMPGGAWGSKMESLGITPEQKSAIHAILERHKPGIWDLAQRGRGIRERLSAVSPDDPGYAEATEQAAVSAAEIAAEGVKLLSEIRAEVHLVLTPEQRQQLREHSDADQKRWDEWRARHRPVPK
jgi:Spy/CpxP family protein refolding chaperone